ncbi:SDR family NAD(P)-dependent oxidoreductase [Nocardia amamiensis]|uniref:SDR family NAD(P)-dependent oxidoreductase n=1 Tax=Nocardia amamiensis TaxID=404578 RepID=UPI000AA3D5D7|nr:SDR family NAD(P)-dependent oxidoreductase [Nocardia amamiensis]
MAKRSEPPSATVLVTGASTGIGRATALLLAREGFTVYAGVRKETDGQALGKTVTPIQLDVTDPGRIAEVAEGLSRLDALINNAGIGVTGPVEFVPLDEWRRQYEVNVFGQLAVTQAMLPMLRASHGRVVTVGSVGSWITLPFGGPLCSSKHAIRSINDAMRMELKPLACTRSSSNPGPPTPMPSTNSRTRSNPAWILSDPKAGGCTAPRTGPWSPAVSKRNAPARTPT